MYKGCHCNYNNYSLSFFHAVLGGSLEDIPIDLKANIEDINVVKVSWAMPKHVKHVIIGFRLFYKSSGINCTDELVSDLCKLVCNNNC